MIQILFISSPSFSFDAMLFYTDLDVELELMQDPEFTNSWNQYYVVAAVQYTIILQLSIPKN